jgi:SAM-dependent methyltransferase
VRKGENGEAARELLELVWGSRREADRLACRHDTRHWAYAWMEEKIAGLCRGGRVAAIADLGGGGVEAHFAGRLARYAFEVLIVDKMAGAPARKNNIRQVVHDMEAGLGNLADESVDFLVSASALEHLTPEGQKRVFRDIPRVLRPGGYFCGTISYVTGLTEKNLALIAADPAFASIGSCLYAPVNIRDNLMAAAIGDCDAFGEGRKGGRAVSGLCRFLRIRIVK